MSPGVPSPYDPTGVNSQIPCVPGGSGGGTDASTGSTGGISPADIDAAADSIIQAGTALDDLELDVLSAIQDAIAFANETLQQCCADFLQPVQQAISAGQKAFDSVGTGMLTQALGLIESATADAASVGIFSDMVRANAIAQGIDLSACQGSEWTDPGNPNCGAIVGPLSLPGPFPMPSPGTLPTPPTIQPPVTGIDQLPGLIPPVPTGLSPTQPIGLGPVQSFAAPGVTVPATGGPITVNVPPCPAPIINIPPCPPCPTPKTPFAAGPETPEITPLGFNAPSQIQQQKSAANVIATSANNWNDPNSCPVTYDLNSSGGAVKISDVLKQLGWIDNNGAWKVLADWLNTAQTGSAIPDAALIIIGKAVRLVLDAGVSWADTLATTGVAVPGCDLGKVSGHVLFLALADAAKRWLGIDLPNVDQAVRYNVNTYCPYSLPTQGEINAAWLSNEINIDQWRCWTRAIGNLDGPQEKIVSAARERPGVADWVTLYLRGKITRDELSSNLRTQGVVNETDTNRFLELADYIPSISDIIRFMVRDVFDPEVVQKYGYDNEFDQKYTADAEKLGRANGFTKEQARYYWRAHWNMPSNTQLYEMFHRQRPDKEGVVNPVTRKDVEDAIRVNDMSPFWVPRLVDISYRQLGRTDARRAYMVGAITRSDYVSSLRDIGFSQTDAERLSQSTVRAKQRAAVKELCVREFIAFQRSELDTRRELAELGYESDIVQLAMSAAVRRLKSDTAKACIHSLRRQFFQFELSDNELSARATELGLSAVQAEALIARLHCERSARGRLIPANQLCKWYGMGLITFSEYRSRLKRLGYTDDDVGSILHICDFGVQTKKLMQAGMKKAAAEQAAAAELTEPITP